MQTYKNNFTFNNSQISNGKCQNKLSIGSAFEFNPMEKNMQTQNGGYQAQQMEIKELGGSFKPTKFSQRSRRMSGDANSQAQNQGYFNKHSKCCQNNDMDLVHCHINKMKNYKQEQSDRSTDCSASSSNGERDFSYGRAYNGEQEESMEGAGNFILMNKQMQNDHMRYEATRGGKKKNFKNAEERIQFKQSYEKKKKTELCRNFEMVGYCRFGDTCSYAHGRHQLQIKTHLPSNFMTKLCTQFHEDGVCMYGERCQFLHSIYDLKTELTYTQALREGARLTDGRNNQISKDTGAECLWANLKTGNGCGAPKGPRLACFESIYNKDSFQEEQKQLASEDQYQNNSNKQAQQMNTYKEQNNTYNLMSIPSPVYTKYNSCNVQYNNQSFEYQHQQYQKHQYQPLSATNVPFVPCRQPIYTR